MTILGEEPITRRRFATGAYGTDGRYTAGSFTDTAGTGTVQPPNGDVLEMLDLGERASRVRRVITKLELRVADQATSTLADQVLFDGDTYKVIHVDDWRAVLPNFDATIIQVKEEQP